MNGENYNVIVRPLMKNTPFYLSLVDHRAECDELHRLIVLLKHILKRYLSSKNNQSSYLWIHRLDLKTTWKNILKEEQWLWEYDFERILP